MENTDHHLLVGKGAQEFARSMGFKIEDDLNTENSRAALARMEAAHRSGALPRSRQERAEAGYQRRRCEMVARRADRSASTTRARSTATASTPKGEICGVTTTSGLAWKIPGRVGDSPILGAGLYVDGEVGAAGSTGRGEANLYNLSLVPDRRGDAARRAPQGRGHGGARSGSRPTRSRSGCSTTAASPNFERQLLRPERARRISSTIRNEQRL